MVHSPLQIMSTIQPSSPCKMPSNNDYGLHSQYYSPHTHPHHHHSHHQGLVGNENNSKFGSNILSIATSGILEGNLFSSKDNSNGGNHLPALENGSLSDKLIPHYGGPSTDFLTQPYTTNHQSSSWYQPPRSPHFHNQMNNMSNGNNTPFTDSWAAAAASMVNVLPHCNYSLSSSPVYGHSVSTHRHQTQSTQYGERNPYQYQYNVGGYMPNIEPINPTASELDLNRGNPNSVAVVNSGGGGDVSICEEKPQMSSGEDIDKSDDETLNCGTSATFGNSNRPQPARSPYEWIKKSSYQSQNQTNGKTRTRDKYRVVYSDHQRLELEKEFHYSRYITIRRKADLASMLGLSERQVKIWFQNRRAKERKQQKKREEITKGTKDTSGQISSHHVLLGSYNPSIDGQVPIPLPTGNGTY